MWLLTTVSSHFTNTNKLIKHLWDEWYSADTPQSSVALVEFLSSLHKPLPLELTNWFMLGCFAFCRRRWSIWPRNERDALPLSFTYIFCKGCKGIVKFRAHAIQPGTEISTQALYELVPRLVASMQDLAAQEHHHTKVGAVQGSKLVFSQEVHDNSLASLKAHVYLRRNCTMPGRAGDLDRQICLLSVPQA